MARLLAADAGIELEPACWPILLFMRAYRSGLRVAPDVCHAVDFPVKGTGP